MMCYDVLQDGWSFKDDPMDKVDDDFTQAMCDNGWVPILHLGREVCCIQIDIHRRGGWPSTSEFFIDLTFDSSHCECFLVSNLASLIHLGSKMGALFHAAAVSDLMDSLTEFVEMTKSKSR